MHVVTSLCVSHVDDTPVQQTQEVDSHFPVGNAIVFLRDDRSIEVCPRSPCSKCIHKKQGLKGAGYAV